MNKALNFFEWTLACISLLINGLSWFYVMFSDNPSFEAKLNTLQRFTFDFQGLVSPLTAVILIGEPEGARPNGEA